MSKFKVGDRVAVYYLGRRDVNEVYEICDDSWMTVKDEAGAIFNVHPKQCRRLIKRKK